MPSVRRLPVLTSESLSLFHSITVETGDAIAVEAEKLGATCGPSCSGCCYQAVYIFFVEGLQIARWLFANKLVTPELKDALKKARIGYIDLRYGTWKDSAAYFSERRPCVFLNGDSCGIYDGRPMTCRNHFVKSPPEWCAPGSEHNSEVMVLDRSPIKDKIRAVVAAVEDEIDLKPEHRGLGGPLPAMVLAGIAWLEKGEEAASPYLQLPFRS